MADEDGPSGQAGVELTPAPAPTPARPRRRMLALSGVLAVLGLGAGAIVVHSGNADPPRLPIALDAAPGQTRVAAPSSPVAADMAMAPYATYVAGADLPALGGSGPAYRLSGAVSQPDANALARALGLTSSPTKTGTGWRLAGDRGVLEISGSGGGSWWFSSAVPTNGSIGGSSGGGVASASGVGGPVTAVAVVTTAPANTSQPAPPAAADTPAPITSVPPATACAPDHPCTDPGFLQPPVAPAADLPSKVEARRIALDLVSATGFEVRDADVTVEGPQPLWYVSVAPHVAGQVVSGLVASVSVGSKGKVESASGYLGRPERVGSYPLVDTRAAIARLDAHGGSGFGTSTLEPASPGPTTTMIVPPGDIGSTPAPAPDVPVPAPAPAPARLPAPAPARLPAPAPARLPAPAPAPVRIVLHRADPILLVVPASDGSGDLYLVPGYRFQGDGAAGVDAIAISDGALAPVSGGCARPVAAAPACPPGAVRPMGEAK